MPNYRLLKDAYYGEGGFYDGGYLVKFERETKEAYQVRRKMSYYINYFANIVDSLVYPIFKKTPGRNYDGAGKEYIDTFLNNVDNKGTGIQNFMKDAALRSKLLGSVFICVDNMKAIPSNMADTITKRALPYAYVVEPEFIVDYSLDSYGKLTMIAFEESLKTGQNHVVTRRTQFDTKRITTRINGSVVSDTEHGLGEIPVVYFPSVVSAGRQTIKPPSKMMPFATIARAIYNYQSYSEEIMRNQAFSILVMPTLDKQNIDIGTSNAIGYDPNTTNGAKPEYIAPPSDPANVLMEERKFLVQEMYRMAGLAFVTGTKQESSGASKQWDFEKTNQLLVDFSDQCQQAEQKMVELMERWLGIDCGYNVSYADDFGISDMQEEITNAQSLLDMDLAPGMKPEVLKKLLSLYLPDLPPERFDELVKEAETAEIEQASSTQSTEQNGVTDNGTSDTTASE